MDLQHTCTTARMHAGSVASMVAATVLLCVTPATALADDDLPTRVGRVSEVAGALYLASEGGSDWVPIAQNYPVAASDRLWLGGEGRAEIDFGVSQMRLAGNTSVQVEALDEHRLALFIASGRAIVRLRTLEPEDSVVVDTPQTQIRFDRPGSYRVEVDSDRRETVLAVREGEADIRSEGGVQQVLPGQSAMLAASDVSRANIVDGLRADAFDAWSIARDRIYDRFRTAYVAREMVGAVDLDTYGTWENYATYGNVWFPTVVAVGWAPYRFGRWVWCGPWGWTWVDDAPWGYAPFHYGRWVYVSGRWGWCPGAFSRHPVWAPALVAWFGGPDWTFAGGSAPIFGWVPLAWGEPFRPHWRCSERCWHGLNEAVAADRAPLERHPRKRFANSDVPGAVSAVPASVLSEGKAVGFNVVRVPPRSLAAAPALDAAPPIRSRVSAPQPARAMDAISGKANAPVDRAAAPPSSTPREAGRLVSTPAHGGTTNRQREELPRTYGGVQDGRGAYTGVAPTPGPKFPAASDTGYALEPSQRTPSQSLPRAVAGPAIRPPPAVAAPAPGAVVPALPPTAPLRSSVPEVGRAPAAQGHAPTLVNPGAAVPAPK